tara:strand:- start:227 stop:421 length:195 start_codon:yes stop_codon:yes gene_type:complete
MSLTRSDRNLTLFFIGKMLAAVDGVVDVVSNFLSTTKKINQYKQPLTSKLYNDFLTINTNKNNN